MRKTKRGRIIFWLVFATLFCLLYFQNRDFFEYHDKLNLDLFVFEFGTSPLPVAVFYVGFFFLGFLVAFFQGMIKSFRAKKQIQTLENKLQEQQQEIESLKNRTGSSEAEDSAGAAMEDADAVAEENAPDSPGTNEKTEH